MKENAMPKVAIVTGSTSGIGLAIAEALAGLGHIVIVNSFSDTAADHAVAKAIADGTGAKVVYRQADMSKAEDCRALVAWTEKEFGSVDILVNNAGIQYVAPVEEFPIEQWNRIIAINLSSAFHTTAAALPGMKARDWGRIVNIASAHGLRASPNKSAYVAAKHGVVGLTKTVALESARSNITCNAVCPGFVLTPLVEKQIDDRAKELGLDRETVIRDVILEKQPSKKFASVGEIAAATLYLVSDGAASVTGTTISVDGGWTAQ
nr:3-hydroxybutyrate dehydrogenase [Mesorhizobium australicum]